MLSTATYQTLFPAFDMLQSERLIVRPYQEGDAQALFEAVDESYQIFIDLTQKTAQRLQADLARSVMAPFVRHEKCPANDIHLPPILIRCRIYTII